MPTTAIPGIDRTRLPPMPIRGRDHELKIVLAQIDSLRKGRGGVMVVEGAAGVGKSRLLTELQALGARGGVRTLRGEAVEHQENVPFVPLFAATLGSGRPVGDGGVLRELGASPEAGYWVVQHLQAAIAAEAERSPLLVVLEDVHWADIGTLMALRALTAELADVPVLWALSMRVGAGGPAVAETLAALRRAGATTLRMSSMSRGAVADMVADVVRARVGESLTGMAAKARGNPFLVTELLRGLREEGRLHIMDGVASVTGQDLPECLVACMQRRLDVLSTDASEVVRVAAILPERFSAGLLAAMLERQPAALLPALAETEQVGLLVGDGEHLRFGHRLLREATRDCLPQSLRRAMERQSASLMLRMGAAPVEVAETLMLSAEPGDRAAAAELRRAARAAARTDMNAAADFSKRALELVPAEDPEHGRVAAETVALLNRARRYEESEELAVTALARATVYEEAEIRLRLTVCTRHSSRRRVEEHRRALELGDVDDVTRARHLALLAYNLMLDDIDGRHRVTAEEAVVAAESVDDLEATVIAHVTLACYDAAAGYAGRALDSLKKLCARSRTNDLPSGHLLPAAHYANVLASVGRVEEAADLIAMRVASARKEHSTMAVDIWRTHDASARLAAGELDAARLAAEAEPIPHQADITELDMLRVGALSEIALRTDDRKLLQQMLPHARRVLADGSATGRRTAAHVLALAAWYRGDMEDAARWSASGIELLGTLFTPQLLDQVILRARVAAATADGGRRTSVLRAADTLSRDEIPLFAAVALHARGILDADHEMLTRAADLFRSLSRPLLYAAAAEDAGNSVGGTDHADTTLAWLNSAFDVYTRYGAVADARRVGRRLRQFGVERRIVRRPKAMSGWDSLTESELKVVSLVAQGSTNRAVADQLHLSLHTVKTHVHNAFGKLGVSSRAQLVRAGR